MFNAVVRVKEAPEVFKAASLWVLNDWMILAAVCERAWISGFPHELKHCSPLSAVECVAGDDPHSFVMRIGGVERITISVDSETQRDDWLALFERAHTAGGVLRTSLSF